MQNLFTRHLWLATAIACSLLGAGAAHGSTIVRFDTSLGDIDVRLFDTATPASVANFLNYVTDGDYDESFFHRSPPGFVIQGGGFNWPAGSPNGTIATDPPVVNEPGLTNAQGTLAYAKLGGDPNSATSGWFFNVNNNRGTSPNGLDFQNGGFTVFGRVVGDGLSVVSDIASQTIVNAGGAFAQLPVLDTFNGQTIFREDLVFVNTVTVLNIAEGDYDRDGNVDADDYQLWRSEFGNSLLIADLATSGGTEMAADGNGDGVVDGIDYAIWRESFTAGGGSLAALGLPEPSSGLLALLGLLPLVRRRR